jgi:hypothetical protein
MRPPRIAAQPSIMLRVARRYVEGKSIGLPEDKALAKAITDTVYWLREIIPQRLTSPIIGGIQKKSLRDEIKRLWRDRGQEALRELDELSRRRPLCIEAELWRALMAHPERFGPETTVQIIRQALTRREFINDPRLDAIAEIIDATKPS